MSYESMPSQPPTDAPQPPGVTPVEPTPEAKPTGPTAKTWIIGGVGAVVIAAAAIVGINAASSDTTTVDTATAANGNAATGNGANGAPGTGQGGFGQGRGGTFGSIESIDGTTLTVTGQDGTATKVATTDATTVTSSSEGTVADLKVGDNVRVTGTGSATELAAARVVDSGDVAVADGFGGRGQNGQGAPSGTPPEGMSIPEGMTPPADGQMPTGGPTGANGDPMVFATGTIESIDGSTIVVKGTDGTTSTVTLSDSTTISITKAIKVSDLAKGDTVMVRGETADGTVTATSISEGATGFGGGGPGGNGGVGPNGQSFPGGGAAPGGTDQSSGASGSGSVSN